MPSKSKAQHNLMAMVANNPAAAKRLGIPQSVGQDFMKADKRKGKKYKLGGPTSYSGEDTGEGMEMSTRRTQGGDGQSFKEAFKAARAAGKEQFKWFNPKKGKMETFTTELAGATKPAAAAKTPARTMTASEFTGPKDEFDSSQLKTPRLPPVDLGAAGSASAAAAAPAASGRYKQKAFQGLEDLKNFLRRDAAEKAERNRGAADRFGEFIRNTRMVGGAPDYMKDETGRIRTPESEGMKRGGRIKKYKSGGSVSSASKRADGIARKGKTKGRIC